MIYWYQLVCSRTNHCGSINFLLLHCIFYFQYSGIVCLLTFIIIFQTSIVGVSTFSSSNVLFLTLLYVSHNITVERSTAGGCRVDVTGFKKSILISFFSLFDFKRDIEKIGIIFFSEAILLLVKTWDTLHPVCFL